MSIEGVLVMSIYIGAQGTQDWSNWREWVLEGMVL